MTEEQKERKRQAARERYKQNREFILEKNRIEQSTAESLKMKDAKTERGKQLLSRIIAKDLEARALLAIYKERAAAVLYSNPNPYV